MNTPRVRTSHKPGEVAPNTWSDFEWARQHREDLFAQYGRCIALVYEKQVVGVGQTIEEAAAHAEQQLAIDVEQITPIIHFVGPSNVFRGALRVVQRPPKKQ